MATNRWVQLAPLLLLFTGDNVLRAETAHISDMAAMVDRDPEPRARVGPALRVGTAAGHSTFGSERLTSLGGTIAAAWQQGRFAVEAEYGYHRLQRPIETEEYSGSEVLGHFHRVGAAARFYLGGPGAELLGANSKLLFWVEAGVGLQRGHFLTGERFQRREAVAGFGWLLDHRLKRPLGFPSRVGWHFGWRLVRTGVPKMSYASAAPCKSSLCSQSTDPYDIGLVVGSGVHLSW